MTRLIFVAEIQSPEFEPEMTLDSGASEFAGEMLLNLIKRGKVVWGTVSKVPESAREVMN